MYGHTNIKFTELGMSHYLVHPSKHAVTNSKITHTHKTYSHNYIAQTNETHNFLN